VREIVRLDKNSSIRYNSCKITSVIFWAGRKALVHPLAGANSPPLFVEKLSALSSEIVIAFSSKMRYNRSKERVNLMEEKKYVTIVRYDRTAMA